MSHTCDQSELIFSSQIGTQKLATVFLSSLTSWGWGYGDVWSKKKDRDITITLQSQSTQFHITIAWAQPRPMCPRWEKLHNISSAQCQPGKWWSCVPAAVEPTKQVLRRLEKYCHNTQYRPSHYSQLRSREIVYPLNILLGWMLILFMFM